MDMNETTYKKTAPEEYNAMELWLRFLNAETDEKLEELEQSGYPIMKKAVRVVRDMSDDTRIREAARIREKALHDEATFILNARLEGREEGISSVVNKMRLAGMSDEEINRILSLQ